MKALKIAVLATLGLSLAGWCVSLQSILELINAGAIAGYVLIFLIALLLLQIVASAQLVRSRPRRRNFVFQLVGIGFLSFALLPGFVVALGLSALAAAAGTAYSFVAHEGARGDGPRPVGGGVGA